jgi:hypothetical protein
MNCYFWAPGQTALAMSDCPQETRLIFLNILMISSIYLHLYQHCVYSVSSFFWHLLHYLVYPTTVFLFFLQKNFANIKPYIYPIFIHLIILCIAITGNKICLMPYIKSLYRSLDHSPVPGEGKRPKAEEPSIPGCVSVPSPVPISALIQIMTADFENALLSPMFWGIPRRAF